MRRTLLVVSTIILSFVGYGQSKIGNSTIPANTQSHNLDSTTFVKMAVDFIKQVTMETLSDSSFILADKPFSFEYYDCIGEVSADTALFTKDEIAFIKNHHSFITKWTKDLFPQIKLISADTVKSIFEDKSKWWAYYYKHVGKNLNNFSVPIFLRSNTYCLFYVDNHCDGLCGNGGLMLYKRKGNKWVAIKSYCNWIS